MRSELDLALEEERKLDVALAEAALCDPAEFQELQQKAGKAVDTVNMWTENIGIIISEWDLVRS